MKASSLRVLSIVVFSIAALAALQCSRRNPVSPQGEKSVQESGLVQLSINMSKTLAQVIDRVVVTAENPSKGHVADEMSISGRQAIGSLEVPAGYQWTIRADAYISGVICYSGQSQSIYVTAGDEIPVTINVDRLDSDHDGFYNDEDLFPYYDAQVKVAITYFKVKVSADGSVRGPFFKITINGVKRDSQDFVNLRGSEIYNPYSTTVDIPDCQRHVDISIEVWADVAWAPDVQYDCNGSDPILKAYKTTYDVTSGSFTETSDGTWDGYSVGPQCQIKVEIKMIKKT